jgi:lipopolysaccharide biosynthesis protein
MLLTRPSVPCRVLSKTQTLRDADACIFVSYSLEPAIKPHVQFHLEALASQGFRTVLIVNADRLRDRSRLPKSDALSGAILRNNVGLDFGAWADAFRLMPDLWSANSVLMVNDSVFGPFGDFGGLLARARSMPADVVGLTESNQFARHLQSYFTLLKRPALQNEGLRRFWRTLVNLTGKWEVIRRYEVEMLARYRGFGLTAAGVFADLVGADEMVNPTETRWRQLAAAGFPYIKVNLLKHNALRTDLTGWREVVGNPKLLAIIDAELTRK